MSTSSQPENTIPEIDLQESNDGSYSAQLVLDAPSTVFLFRQHSKQMNQYMAHQT